MRVIAGSKRGLRLISPKDIKTRPTEDRVKENTFNLLGQGFDEAKVLDLFSGTGSIGIEFLSRGAKRAYFVDSSRDAIKIINENIEKTHFENEAVVLKMNAKSAIERLQNEKFDYIYLDPPFDNKNLYIQSVELILDSNILADDGYLVIEQVKDLDVDFSKYLSNVKFKNYGNTSIGIWEKK
ncbi:16S rRNA (guanine(966)-N(2))-methyltransferase RsmD [Peptoniphilus stercorisuis]|uniref:16S rRNA (Guanine(966)-N(2))-methyltransferase RsmD n=1 Tax=Peptoniphilus stercorisuis TaxID=1436965 RepID=A0ABS4KD86_9FIRM|nr:16S rRNA (guanine(966)-N(2))-methyltransferase RsmD [Peptoniphilus stercorisuis]MBP2025335.1 16S rRNA (guanine(966)-N(2))-methyltransferase RsmD [Peptoniphilus stercorisuis]